MNSLAAIPLIIIGGIVGIAVLPAVLVAFLDTVQGIFTVLAEASPMGTFVVFIGLMVLLGRSSFGGFPSNCPPGGCSYIQPPRALANCPMLSGQVW